MDKTSYNYLSDNDFKRIIPATIGTVDGVSLVGQSQSDNNSGAFQSVKISSKNGSCSLLFGPYALIGVLDESGCPVTKVSTEYQALKFDRALAPVSSAFAHEMAKINQKNNYVLHQVAYRIAVDAECKSLISKINAQTQRLENKLNSASEEERGLVEKNIKMLNSELEAITNFVAYNTNTQNSIIAKYIPEAEKQ